MSRHTRTCVVCLLAWICDQKTLHLPINLSIFIFIHVVCKRLSLCPSVCLSVCLSFCRYIGLSVYQLGIRVCMCICVKCCMYSYICICIFMQYECTCIHIFRCIYIGKCEMRKCPAGETPPYTTKVQMP